MFTFFYCGMSTSRSVALYRLTLSQPAMNTRALCPTTTIDKHLAADVVAKAQAVLSEPELLRAMFDVGYFPAEHAAGAMSRWRNEKGSGSRPTSPSCRTPLMDERANKIIMTHAQTL